jgi:uncharacterized protein YodC (DUF2158 family)
MAFRVGDVVRLKSGGLAMTVTEAKKDEEVVVCQWHDVKGKPRSWGFNSAALNKDKTDV